MSYERYQIIDKEILLICTPLRFYTQNDEVLCFEWIKKIKCIKKHIGVARELHLYVSSNKITDSDLLDLLGLFDRYKFDSSQLQIFKNKKNKELFEE